jgi:hypothetical protein
MDPGFTSQATLIGYEHQKSTIDAIVAKIEQIADRRNSCLESRAKFLTAWPHGV